MNISGTLTCLNCGEIMQQGGTEFGPRGMVQFRHCKCGLNVFLFTEVKGYEYSLMRKRKDDEDKKIDAQVKLMKQKWKELSRDEKKQFLRMLERPLLDFRGD